MAWITPKITWTDNDRVKPDDLNRIFGNLNHIAGTNLKTDYTQNDFLTAANWNALITKIRTLELGTRVVASAADAVGTLPGTDMTASTFNAAETYLSVLKERLEYMFRQQAAVCYAGDPVFASDVPDTFSRGM